jgi:drug/metabolite transporter (DMT)-like permease
MIHSVVPPAKLKLAGAFTAVYIIWGSTYLAIRFAIETIPPFLMAGIRFVVAGSILYAWTRFRGAPKPTPVNWKSAAMVGGLLLLVGNGGVTWAEQLVSSGNTALLIATVPFWLVVLDWLWKGGGRPSAGVITGLALGFAGIVLLVGPGNIGGPQRINLVGAGVLMIATFSWAVGSLYSRTASLPATPQLATAMEMLTGGAWLVLAGSIAGEWNSVDLARVSVLSSLSLFYLIVFGSLIAFSAYIWLLRSTTPARVGTYAYVNPVVAVLLGWLFADELVTGQTITAAAIIIAAVVAITSSRSKSPTPVQQSPSPDNDMLKSIKQPATEET